jgi:hypothetical protein
MTELKGKTLSFEQVIGEPAPEESNELQAEQKRNEYLARQVIELQTNYDNQVEQNQFLTNELYNANQVKDYYQNKWDTSEQLNTLLMKQILSLKGE